MSRTSPTRSPAVASTLARPPAADLVLLGIAVVAISTSAPLIAACTAPALAIAFWRTTLGAGITAVWVALRHRAEVTSLSRRQWRLTALSGLFLASHFAVWVPSLRLTSVASSTALVATQPVWAALIARRRGMRIERAAWLGIGTALVGVLLLTGVDFVMTPSALIGDGMAVAGAMLAALYVSVGEQVRPSTSNATYTTICYGVAGLALLVPVLILRVPLTGFSARDWVLIAAITLGAQLLGHSLVNRVLATTSAMVVSLAILLELPGATVIAAAWLGQIPTPAVLPAVALIFVGIVMVIRTTTAATGAPTETPPA